MQKLSGKKIRIVPGSGQKVSGPLAPKKGFALFGLFASPRAETRGGNTATLLKEPVLKSPLLNVPRADLTAVKNLVALEEKIVHDYKEQKTVQLKSAVSMPKTPAKQPLPGPSNLNNQKKKVSSPSVAKKGFTFFGLFTSPRAETRGENTATVLKEPVLKSPHLNVPRADLPAVNSWVALEEKIVHDYKEQKTTQLKSAVSLPETPAKQPVPAFETFSTQTAVTSSPSPGAPKLKDPLRGSEKTFSKPGKFLRVLGWLAAGAFALLYVHGTFLSRETSQKLSRLQSEKEQLGRSYTELKNASGNQGAEMKWLNSQLHDMALELKTAKANKEELMRITVRYESQLAALRGTVQTQTAIVNALKAQSQAFEMIIDQAGMSAFSSAAAGLSQEPLSTGGPSMSQGMVTSVDGRQGFVVISMGSAQGARSGRWITISRSGVGLAAGRIDRVYPTMSVAVLRDAGMLQVIQEGDSVSFS